MVVIKPQWPYFERKFELCSSSWLLSQASVEASPIVLGLIKTRAEPDTKSTLTPPTHRGNNSIVSVSVETRKSG